MHMEEMFDQSTFPLVFSYLLLKIASVALPDESVKFLIKITALSINDIFCSLIIQTY